MLLCVVIFSLFIHKQILAEESRGNVLKKEVKTKSINQSGFIFDLQKVDPKLLADDVEKLKGAFIERQSKLRLQVEDKKLGAGDAIIAVIMPGGLFYAGYRKQELEQAKSDLTAVTEEIVELSIDLIALQNQLADRPLILAQRP